jgi:hypothetical protein
MVERKKKLLDETSFYIYQFLFLKKIRGIFRILTGFNGKFEWRVEIEKY